MANTMKFGNGQWATQKDSILAFNDENANFKPLPFTASRASTATVVNKAGLLETVASGIPRVDYLSNTSGAYLLEPSSTNLITQSEAFGNSYWTKSGASIEGDASTAGSEKVVNGDFAGSSAGWSGLDGVTITYSNNAIVFATTNNRPLAQSLVLEAGKTYLVSYEIKAYNSGNISFYTGSSNYIMENNTVGVHTGYINSNGDTNIYLRSQSIGFSGTIDNVSVKEVQGFASPSASSPLGAFKLVASTTTDYISATAISTGNNNITVSYFVKADTLSNFSIVEAFYFGTVTNFDLSLETSDNGKIEKIGNGWYRCSASYTYGVGQEIIATQLKTGAIGSIYIFGAQLEAQSYPTSYIPTAGSAITRLADTASQKVPDGVINSSEGTWFFNIADLANGTDYKQLSISNESYNNNITIFSTTVKNKYVVQAISGGSTQVNVTLTLADTTAFNKIAIKWKLNDFAIWINGVEVYTNSSYAVISESILYRVAFSGFSGASIFYGKCKDLRVYKTALTDAELAALTTI